MLRANRRHRLLYLALAALDCATVLPWLLLALRSERLLQPVLVFALLWTITIGFMFAADWLNARPWGNAARAAALIAIVGATAWLAASVWLGAPLGVRALAAIGQDGSALLLLALLLFLWWRVAALTSRDLGFFQVGLSFRFGMLVALLGAGLLSFASATGVRDALLCLALYFGAGLTASALARIDDKALLADGLSVQGGALLPWGRLLGVLGVVAATLLAAAGAAWLAAPHHVARAFGLFAPVGWLLGRLLQILLALLLWLLTPLMNLLERWIQALLAGRPEAPPLAEPADFAPLPDGSTLSTLWAQSPLLRWALIGLAVAVALLLIGLFFARTLASLRADGDEELVPVEPEVDHVRAERAAGRRGLWGLLRRYGVGQGLLAAISVQNLYANVTRLARRRGYPRPPALSPDDYLPRLREAFPGRECELARLTDAYMRVHYGDAPVLPGELAALRADYHALRRSAAAQMGTVYAPRPRSHSSRRMP